MPLPIDESNGSKHNGGVYVIYNTINLHFYVGITTSFLKRRSHHLYDLRRGAHHSKHFQNAWNKYGENFFIFYILQEENDRFHRSVLEQELINIHYHKPYCYNTYPISNKSYSTTTDKITLKKIHGRVKTDVEREKISSALLGKYRRYKDRGETEKVKQILDAFRNDKLPTDITVLTKQEIEQCKVAYDKWPRGTSKLHRNPVEYERITHERKLKFKQWLIKNGYFIDKRSDSWTRKNKTDQEKALKILRKYRHPLFGSKP